MMNAPLFSACWVTFKHEVLMIYRHFTQVMNPLLFFGIGVSLFPLGISPEPHVLQQMGPGIVWITVLLAILLGLERLFHDDLTDGWLEQWLLNPQPLALLLLVKLLAHWLMSVFPLVITATVLGVLFYLSKQALLVLMLTLLLGTPVLLFIGAIGKALTMNCRNSSLLVPLLILPLSIPLLIFGSSSVALANQGYPVLGQLAFLGALLALAIPLSPLAIATVLRMGVH